MNVLEALIAGPAAFHGEGVNEENEAFLGTLRVQALEGGRAALLFYTARLVGGTLVHSESSLLATGPGGRLCLWPVMSEIPVVLPHTEVETEAPAPGEIRARFASGPRAESASFREEITIVVGPNGSLVYAHAWGLPGGAFEDRSSCRMRAADANQRRVRPRGGAMAETKTRPTSASIDDHLAARATPAQLPDCHALMAVLARVTKQTPAMWGPSIVGYGAYTYTYESGRSGASCLTGFAIRGRELAIYLVAEGPGQADLLARLGPHRIGKSCLYLKRLADVDLRVLEQLVAGSVAEAGRRHPAREA